MARVHTHFLTLELVIGSDIDTSERNKDKKEKRLGRTSTDDRGINKRRDKRPINM
jgi:hypothetical protein